MLRKFLRLFSAYRELEAELESAAAARIAAEDSVREMRDKMQFAIEEKDRSREELSHSLKQIANFEALRNGPMVPFPEVYRPVEAPVQSAEQGPELPSPPRSMRAFELAARTKSRQAAAERRSRIVEALDEVTA